MTPKLKGTLFRNKLFKYALIVMLILALPEITAGLFNGVTNQAAAASDPVIAAAGDIACDPLSSNFNNGNGSSNACREKATSDLLLNAGLAGVLALGDDQYYCGSLQAFNQSYDPSWGRLKSITHPSVGNHEYLTSGGSSPATGCDPSNNNAAGYFSYYGSAAGTPGQGYYSFDIGTWHLIALNSNCSNAGGCSTSSPQYKWLQSDLAAHTNFCTLAFWHIPLYSSGGRAAANTQQFWNLLYANDADLILNGHDHIYERFAAQNPSAAADPTRGIREFIVGTGGADHTTITTVAANSEVRNTNSFGILKLTLHPTSYDWQFVPEPGKTFTDSGTTACHGTAPTPTRTSTITRTPTASRTPTGSTGTSTPTSTRTATATPTATGTVATNTATFTRIATATATSTGTATNTPLVTNTPTNTFTTTSTPTNTSAVTNTPTQTPTNTLLVTNTPTFTPTVTNTPLATNTPTNTPTPTATSSGGNSFTFTSAADAYVDSSNPTANFGTGTTIRVDGSPIVNTYIRFNVSGVSGTITRVRLLIFANSSGSQGVRASGVADNSWVENTVNFNTAPAMGSQLAASSAFTTGTWVTLDVTGYVSGDGTYSFGITDPNATAISLAARESGANAPQLIVDTQ